MRRVYSIYHVKDERFCKEFDESKYCFPKDYEFVAQLHVESESIEDGLDIVFEKSNTIDHYWGENEEVFYISDDRPGYRSLSVGDVIRIALERPLGEGWVKQIYHRVAKCGFDRFEVDKNEQEIKEVKNETAD
jgi:hypothetical protein